MAFTSLTPNIMVDDMARTLEFYQNVLGFTLLASVPEATPYNWAMLKRGAVEIMFQTRASLGEEIPAMQDWAIGGNLTFYIHVDDVQSLYDDLKGKVELVQEMRTTFYNAKEFGFKDCNGFVLVLSQSMA